MLRIRLALLLVAAGASVLSFGLAHHRAGQAQEAYACPMHPDVHGRGAVPCPICGMALQRPGGAPPVPETVRASVLVVADPIVSLAWAEGSLVRSLLYDDEVKAVRVGEVVGFAGARLQLAEVTRWEPGMSLLRWRVLSGRPPASGAIELGARSRAVTVLPHAAVVNGPEGAHALMPGLALRPLIVGRSAYDFVTVVKGLESDEAVVSPAALWEAERRR